MVIQLGRWHPNLHDAMQHLTDGGLKADFTSVLLFGHQLAKQQWTSIVVVKYNLKCCQIGTLSDKTLCIIFLLCSCYGTFSFFSIIVNQQLQNRHFHHVALEMVAKSAVAVVSYTVVAVEVMVTWSCVLLAGSPGDAFGGIHRALLGGYSGTRASPRPRRMSSAWSPRSGVDDVAIPSTSYDNEWQGDAWNYGRRTQRMHSSFRG